MQYLINSEQIKARVTIHEAAESSYRSIAYDVRAGKIIAWGDGKIHVEENWVIPPQGIVEVISKEKFKLPADIAGYAMVRTRLCNEGILALNIGIVDPLFEGPVSTTLLNFSKVPYPLRQGEVFLRLTFHECGLVPAKDEQLKGVELDYVNERIKKASKFDESFLNLPGVLEKAASPIFWRYLTAIGLVLASLTLFLNLTIAWVGRQLWNNQDDLRKSVLNEIRVASMADPTLVASMREELRRLQASNEELRKKIEHLESRVQVDTTVPAPTNAPRQTRTP